MSLSEWVVLEEDGGKTYLVELVDKVIKIKGLGVFNPMTELNNKKIGNKVTICLLYTSPSPRDNR